jgi:foldase protein PrsA
VPEGSVASVDGVVITEEELDELLERARVSYEAQQQDFPKVGTTEHQALQAQAASFLVQRVQYDRKAEELGITVSDKEVDDRVAEVQQEFFGGDEKEFTKQLKEQGYTEESFRADIQSQLLTDKLFEDVTKEVKVTDAEAKQYYNENKAQFDVPESRDVRHILVRTKKQANSLYDELKSGGNFAVLAKKHSLDPGSKDSGGQLTVTRGQTVKPFDTTAFLLPKNALSRPVKTEFGYHLIQPTSEVKPARTTPFKEVSSQIKQQLRDQRTNEAVTAWASELQAEYEDKTAYGEGYAPPDVSGAEEEAPAEPHGG